MVFAAGNPSDSEGRRQLERLVTRYWKPVYHYIRRTWSKSNEDGKDLTQAFFVRLLEGGDLHRITPEQGSLRAYLKTALSHFLIDQKRFDTAAKRGGDKAPLTLEPSMLEEVATRDGTTPDQAFDKEWAATCISDAVHQLDADLQAEGREVHARVFRAYYLIDGASPAREGETSTYPAVAEQLGLKPHDVKNYLIYARHRLRTILEEKTRQLTTSEADAASELRLILES